MSIFLFSATQPSSAAVSKTEDQRPQLGVCNFKLDLGGREYIKCYQKVSTVCQQVAYWERFSKYGVSSCSLVTSYICLCVLSMQLTLKLQLLIQIKEPRIHANNLQ